MGVITAEAAKDARKYLEFLVNRVKPEDVKAFLEEDKGSCDRGHVESVTAAVRALDIKFHGLIAR